ncbi:MAG: nucleotidyltransferase family protein [Pseudorhodobacter sp.]|nr:nucleotidyltransferase family protein [Pseudorhodobacter sp.]
MAPQQPSILILAAGAATRMRGADKMLERVDGVAQIRRITAAALATGCRVAIALPPDRPDRAAAVEGLPVIGVIVKDAQDGMAASIRAGLAALPANAALMILLADLPELTHDDLNTVLRAQAETPELIIRACSAAGIPGHPVCFPPMLRAELASLRGDMGARALLARHKTRCRTVALPANHAITDLDTPEDWAAWRASRLPKSD